MSKFIFPKNSTSKIIPLYIQDNIFGMPASGIAFNTAGMFCYYHRNTSPIVTQLILQSGVVGTFIPSGFVEIDRSKFQGGYQLCLPDSAYAAGADSVMAILKCSGVLSSVIEIQLTDAAVGYIAQSGIDRNSYVKQSELSVPPTFPISPIDMQTWIFERSFNLNKTTSLADFIYKNDGVTILASGQVSDDGNQFIRQKYQ